MFTLLFLFVQLYTRYVLKVSFLTTRRSVHTNETISLIGLDTQYWAA